jgi:succinyl-CoA synthetase alpha subunit
MSILLGRDTRVIIQGITGAFGSYHSLMMKEYGTRIVAGVTPGKGGAEVNGVPVYDSIAEARDAEGGDTICVLVPAPFVKDAVFEAADAGIGLVVCLVEGVPVKDTMLMKRHLGECGALMVGPNSPGVVTPGQSLVGFMPGHIYTPGPVGIVSRSGTFSYQVADALTRSGVGQSTCLGIGGDPVSGISFVDVLARFEEDPETRAICLIGEIGRTAEEEAAAYIADHVTKPVSAMILGATAPADKQMGHAGAIISAGRGSHASKVSALRDAGVLVARTASELARLVVDRLR